MTTQQSFSKTATALSIGVFVSSTLLVSIASAHSLPLGDGNVSTSPTVGNVYSCQTSFNPNAPGAQASGDWLNEAAGTWDPDIKPIIDGSVSWPSEIDISIRGNQRIITGNGLPDHATGTFPVARSDDAYQYDRNPNQINAQNVLLTLDTNPQLASSPTCVPMGMIGFALSGAAIYNALDARGDDAPAHEIQDACNGHPEQQGEYHYHNLSPCLEDTQSGPDGHSDLLGYALDGFGIFGVNENNQSVMFSKDLDTCHGHVGEIEWDGKLVEMYHYHFTEDYPYTLGCFAGEVTASTASTQGQPDNQLRGNDRQDRPNARNGQGPRRERAEGQRPEQVQGQRGPRNGQGQRPGRGDQGGRGNQIMELVATQLGVDINRLIGLTDGPPPDFAKIANGLGLNERQVRQAFNTARQQAN